MTELDTSKSLLASIGLDSDHSWNIETLQAAVARAEGELSKAHDELHQVVSKHRPRLDSALKALPELTFALTDPDKGLCNQVRRVQDRLHDNQTGLLGALGAASEEKERSLHELNQVSNKAALMTAAAALSDALDELGIAGKDGNDNGMTSGNTGLDDSVDEGDVLGTDGSARVSNLNQVVQALHRAEAALTRLSAVTPEGELTIVPAVEELLSFHRSGVASTVRKALEDVIHVQDAGEYVRLDFGAHHGTLAQLLSAASTVPEASELVQRNLQSILAGISLPGSSTPILKAIVLPAVSSIAMDPVEQGVLRLMTTLDSDSDSDSESNNPPVLEPGIVADRVTLVMDCLSTAAGEAQALAVAALSAAVRPHLEHVFSGAAALALRPSGRPEQWESQVHAALSSMGQEEMINVAQSVLEAKHASVLAEARRALMGWTAQDAPDFDISLAWTSRPASMTDISMLSTLTASQDSLDTILVGPEGEQAAVSKGVIRAVEVMMEAVESFGESSIAMDVGRLYQAGKLALYGKSLEEAAEIPGVASVMYNDGFHFATALAALPDQSPELARLVCAIQASSESLLRSMANKMAAGVVAELVADAKTLDDAAMHSAAVANALQRGAGAAIQTVRSVTRPVSALSPSIGATRVAGVAVDALAMTLSNAVLGLKDVSVDDGTVLARELKAVRRSISDVWRDGFGSKYTLAEVVPWWRRFCAITDVFEDRLAVWMERWNTGALSDFAAEDVSGLVQALWDDSENRKIALHTLNTTGLSAE